MPERVPDQPDPSEGARPLLGRRVLTGALGVGLALPVLAACGGGDDSTEPEGSGTGSDSGTDSGNDGGSDGGAGGGDQGGDSGGGGGESLAGTADVPVGGGVVNADAKVVVTQPEEGEFRAFTAVCTHQGCTVTGVTETINCPCHGSQFSITDGSVVGGPAPSPLDEIEVTVSGGQVTRA